MHYQNIFRGVGAFMFWERLNQLCDEHNVKLTNVVKELGVPLSAYPNPSLYGERYSFKQEDTPYHNGRECPFLFFAGIAVGLGALQST